MVNRRPNIWKLQAEKDIDGLQQALTHPDPDIRKRATAALRVIGTTKALFALQRAFEREQNPYVREHISSALTYLDHGDLIEEFTQNRNVSGLVEMLNSPNTEEVLAAIEALSEIGDPSATEGLVMVFRNPLLDDGVRLAAAEVLLKLESAPAVVTLLGAMRKDDWQVRRNAVTVLGQLRATWATQPLINALSDEHAKVRQSAQASLKLIGSPEALGALQRHQQAEKLSETGRLQGIVDQQFKGPDLPAQASAKPLQKVMVGTADEDDSTMVSKSEKLRQGIQEAIKEGRRDNLSPALAAAEAALAEMSPDAESLFDITPENGDDDATSKPSDDATATAPDTSTNTD